MNITLRQVQAFLAVAELGSFTRAAEKLGMTQPALSLLVRELEGHLGLKLLDRTTRRSQVADGAVEIEQSIRQAYAQMEEVVRRAGDIAALRSGTLRVAAPPTFSAAIMPWAISEFRRIYPGVDITLLDTLEAIEIVIEQDRADLGVGTFSPVETTFDRTLLMKDKLCVIAPADSALAQKSMVEWNVLNGMAKIGLSTESGIRALVDRALADAGIPGAYDFTVHSINTVLSFVESGLGIAVLPSYAMALRGARRIVAIELVNPVVSREISIVKKQGRSLAPAALKFIEILRKSFRLHFPSALPETSRGEIY